MTNPKHTSSDLVAEIRKEAAIQIGFDGPAYQTLTRWADRIEALEAENERLREAVGILEDGLQEVGDDYPGSSCQEWCQHQIKQARAALKEIDNGDR